MKFHPESEELNFSLLSIDDNHKDKPRQEKLCQKMA